MAGNQRVYSDEEFALILRKTAELASRAESPGSASTGLTLAEMKAAAGQVGFDPALVEQAARSPSRAATGPRQRGRCESESAQSWMSSARLLLNRKSGRPASV
jgi:hypothetical protein